MSIFNELLLKINEIPNGFTENIKDDLKSALELLEEFKTDYISSKTKARELAQKAKILTTTLQSINEDEDEPIQVAETKKTQQKPSRSTASAASVQSVKSTHVLDEQNGNEKPMRVSKKRSKDEVEDMSSPEQDKRPKRNASVRAQTVISKQVNVNLTQKMRRDEPEKEPKERSSRRRRGKEDKENAEPIPIVQVKQEKISVPPEEAMEFEPLPTEAPVKKEVDEIAMPPPTMPVPKPRGRPKNKNKDDDKEIEKSEVEESGRSRRNTRKKQTDTMPQPVPSARSTRASSRASSRQNSAPDEEVPPPEPRPKRTRAKKKVSEPPPQEPEKAQEDSVPASPAEKPRPKRTRRGKAAEKQQEKPIEPEVISPKEERITIAVQTAGSPILPNQKDKNNVSHKEPKQIQPPTQVEKPKVQETAEDLEKTRVIHTNVTRQSSINATIEVPAHSTPKNTMNETVVLERNRDSIVLEKQQNVIMDATVIIEKAPAQTSNLTEDESIMTNDDSDYRAPTTPPPSGAKHQPTSAVKEKVQKFEELASRVTRTKTRAMAKNVDEQETQTPPDKIGKNGLSAETLTKMNNLIFNGKPQHTQLSNSACKSRANVPVKTNIPNSTSKITTINKLREEELAREKEDARSKKEALLEARRELQRRKREEKMAAAAAAREQAERERQAALEAAARGREEKQIHADLGRAERLREAERKKQELARKVAETEERRRAEERARQQRLAEEQKRAEIARKKQQEEAEAVKKEAALMAREIEKRQKEYIEKQKMKRMEAEKIATPVKAMYPSVEPVYMKDGFEYLNSDEEEDSRPRRPPPPWNIAKARNHQLSIQSHIKAAHIDRWFSVRVHTVDLREIFPEINPLRRDLKRTSSAVWRTPDRLPAVQE